MATGRMQICRSIFAKYRYENEPVVSGVTQQKFTKFLQDVATSSSLLDSDIATHFRAIVQRMQVVSVGVHDIFPKSIDCHGNVP